HEQLDSIRNSITTAKIVAHTETFHPISVVISTSKPVQHSVASTNPSFLSVWEQIREEHTKGISVDGVGWFGEETGTPLFSKLGEVQQAEHSWISFFRQLLDGLVTRPLPPEKPEQSSTCLGRTTFQRSAILQQLANRAKPNRLNPLQKWVFF